RAGGAGAVGRPVHGFATQVGHLIRFSRAVNTPAARRRSFAFCIEFLYFIQMLHDEVIPILDFGAQYAQLIARRVRECGVFSELVRPDISIEDLRKMNPKGLILSGGPSSVYEPNAPKCDPRIFSLGIPVLGICYGMQLACDTLGGKVTGNPAREFGRSRCQLKQAEGLFAGVTDHFDVWMSHGDQVTRVAGDFVSLA